MESTTMSGGGEVAEVDALLRAAQDAVLLKLLANTHLVSSSSSSASNPPSLDHARRLDALRSRPPVPKRPDAASAAGAGRMDELEARLAALKVAAGWSWRGVVGRRDGEGGAVGDGRHAARRGHSRWRPRQSDEKSSEDDDEERLELEMARKRKNKFKRKWSF